MYINNRIEKIPKFIMFGISLGMPEMSIDLETHDTSFDTTQVGLYMGAGATF